MFEDMKYRVLQVLVEGTPIEVWRHKNYETRIQILGDRYEILAYGKDAEHLDSYLAFLSRGETVRMDVDSGGWGDATYTYKIKGKTED